jgi:hypothetical protein
MDKHVTLLVLKAIVKYSYLNTKNTLTAGAFSLHLLQIATCNKSPFYHLVSHLFLCATQLLSLMFPSLLCFKSHHT